MNDTLKAAGNIGAELGAVKAENEKLRGLLTEAFNSLCDGLEEGPLESEASLADRARAFQIKDALSQQSEPVRSPGTEDSASMDSDSTQEQFTAVDMATAAAQGFRDGQKAEPAPAQDERPATGVTIEKDMLGTVHIKVGDFDYVQIKYQYPYTDNASQNALAKRIVGLLTRSAQTEQQPIRMPPRADESQGDAFDTQLAEAYNSALDEVARLNAAPVAQPAQDGQNIEAAAKKLAECFDYPWEYMPEQGRNNIRKHAKAVLYAAQGARDV
jgi:hypothetical protein